MNRQSKIVKLINRLITHNRDMEKPPDFGIRVVIHIPIGILMGLMPFANQGLVDLFLRYEINEDVHTNDEAWKDIFGAMAGFVIGRIAIIVILAVIIIKLIGG